MAYKLGTRSYQNLSGVHPDLVAVVERAIQITKQDFVVIEGIRNIDRQRQLFKAGKSKTMNSRHLTGHAVDICPYPVDWSSKEKFQAINDAMDQASLELKIPVVWGGDWKNAWDKPHYELNRKSYP
jgi:peptidoglycan L-alanyl-D-glutamate endopeptidase CwlK